MVRERLKAFRDAGITTIMAEPYGATVNERLETLARFIALARDHDQARAVSKTDEGRLGIGEVQ